jgi:hypothetical protein
MTHILPSIIRIKPTSSRIAWIIAGALGLAGVLFTGTAWFTDGSLPSIYLLVFGLPTAIFVLLALLARPRSLELRSDMLQETTWNSKRVIRLQGLAGLSLRMSIQGRIVIRQLVFWNDNQRESGQIDITDYPVAQVRRLVAQVLVQSPHLSIDRELQRYLELPRPSSQMQ